MSEAQNGNGYGRAGFWVSLASVLLVVIGAIWWVGGIANQVGEHEKALQDQSRRLDRIADDLRANDLLTSNMKTSDCQQFAKTETQLGTVETVINSMRVDDIRERGLIWPKIFGQPYPSPFYEIKIPHEIMPC